MTENEKRFMLLSVLNGEKWEGRNKSIYCSFKPSENHKEIEFHGTDDWQPYDIGDAIHDNWEYRKCETNWLKEFMKEFDDNYSFKCGVRKGIYEFATKLLSEFPYGMDFSTDREYFNKLVGIVENLGVVLCKKN